MSSPGSDDPSRDNYVDRLKRLGYHPRFMADGAPCAVQEQGISRDRAFVISIPKAGTHLIGAILEALGISSTRLHIDEGWASDFRNFRKGTLMWKYQMEMPVLDALRLVQPGQFALGHLPADDGMLRALGGFKKVFMFRELRHAFVSWARFVIAESMDGKAAEAAARYSGGPERVFWVLTRPSSGRLVPTCRQMVVWRTTPGVLFSAVRRSRGGAGSGAPGGCDRPAGASSGPKYSRRPIQSISPCVRRCGGADLFRGTIQPGRVLG